MEVQENVALAPFTTFHLGGPARFFIAAATLDDIRAALAFARERNAPVLMLGGGSNMLVRDEGYKGMVIKIELKGISVEDAGPHTKSDVVPAGQLRSDIRLSVRAGEQWDSVAARAVREGGWGIENLSGIPGTVGGAVVQNIGAYGAALSQTLVSVEALDARNGEVKTLSAAQCALGYRSSIFKQEEGRYVVLGATLRLSRERKPNLAYKDLAARFEGATPSLQDIRQAVLDIRAAKFPDIAKEGTAGSFFKNPIMQKTQADALKQAFSDMPVFDMPETEGVKVPLAWLLDRALSMKGTSVRGARLFERQPLVIAASRSAASRDVEELASLVQKKVFDELKIKIEPEVKII